VYNNKNASDLDCILHNKLLQCFSFNDILLPVTVFSCFTSASSLRYLKILYMYQWPERRKFTAVWMLRLTHTCDIW